MSNWKTLLILFALAGDASALERADLVGHWRRTETGPGSRTVQTYDLELKEDGTFVRQLTRSDRSERSSQAAGSVAHATARASSSSTQRGGWTFDGKVLQLGEGSAAKRFSVRPWADASGHASLEIEGVGYTRVR